MERLQNAIGVARSRLMYSCKSCDENFRNESDLSYHFDSIHAKSLWTCDTCSDKFTSDGDLSEHTLSKHKEKQWNCDGCSYQASSSKELINHLKLTGHQPSQNILNSKSEITHCPTCKEEFTSYWNLMNHRKQKHPSNRICRYFLKNECIHGIGCWFRHDKPMETESSPPKSASHQSEIKFNVCEKTFENWNSVRVHKRRDHAPKVPCKRFKEWICKRSEQECWYLHNFKESESEKPSDNLGFQFPRLNPNPPDQTQIIMQTLQEVLQRMQMMEDLFQQKKQ